MHIFFDLDGTLTDPREGIVACIRHALDSLGVEIDPAIRLDSFIGPPLKDSFHRLCGDAALATQAVALYRERFSAIGLYENRLHDGIRDCLEQLARRDQTSYVVTSKPTGFSVRIVEHFEIRDHFKVVYGSHLDGRLGDKTDLLGHVLRTEAIDPAEAVMIGDRKFDVIGANNHGIRSIGVLWGYGSEQELREAGADSLCESPLELYQHIFR